MAPLAIIAIDTAVARFISALFSRHLAQRGVDAVLPANAILLKIVEHILVDAQRHGVLHVRQPGSLRRQIRRLGRHRLESLLGFGAGIRCRAPGHGPVSSGAACSSQRPRRSPVPEWLRRRKYGSAINHIWRTTSARAKQLHALVKEID